MSHEQIIWDQALIEKYNYSGPRYTSYPTALELHQALPGANLHIVRDAGHSAMEPGITDNLIKATNQYALRLA